MSEDEPKSPAELKEIRLNRKIAQDAEGIKAMADIAAADVAIRKLTANLRAARLEREVFVVTQPPSVSADNNSTPAANTLVVRSTDIARKVPIVAGMSLAATSSK